MGGGGLVLRGDAGQGGMRGGACVSAAAGFFQAPEHSWKPLGAMFGVAFALGLRTVWATTVIPGSQAGVQAGISPLVVLCGGGRGRAAIPAHGDSSLGVLGGS